MLPWSIGLFAFLLFVLLFALLVSMLTNHLIHSRRLDILLRPNHRMSIHGQRVRRSRFDTGSEACPPSSDRHILPRHQRPRSSFATQAKKAVDRSMTTDSLSRSSSLTTTMHSNSGTTGTTTTTTTRSTVRPLVAKLSPSQRRASIEVDSEPTCSDNRQRKIHSKRSENLTPSKVCTCSTSDSADCDVLSVSNSVGFRDLPDYCCTRSLLLDQRRYQIRLQQQIQQIQRKLDVCTSLPNSRTELKPIPTTYSAEKRFRTIDRKLRFSPEKTDPATNNAFTMPHSKFETPKAEIAQDDMEKQSPHTRSIDVAPVSIFRSNANSIAIANSKSNDLSAQHESPSLSRPLSTQPPSASFVSTSFLSNPLMHHQAHRHQSHHSPTPTFGFPMTPALSQSFQCRSSQHQPHLRPGSPVQHPDSESYATPDSIWPDSTCDTSLHASPCPVHDDPHHRAAYVAGSASNDRSVRSAHLASFSHTFVVNQTLS